MSSNHRRARQLILLLQPVIETKASGFAYQCPPSYSDTVRTCSQKFSHLSNDTCQRGISNPPELRQGHFNFGSEFLFRCDFAFIVFDILYAADGQPEIIKYLFQGINLHGYEKVQDNSFSNKINFLRSTVCDSLIDTMIPMVISSQMMPKLN